MKKFLTMLLALSVVFTYTFGAAGSVFATATNTDAAKYLQTVDEAYGILAKSVDDATTFVKENKAADINVTDDKGNADPSDDVTYTIEKAQVVAVIDGAAKLVKDELDSFKASMYAKTVDSTVSGTSLDGEEYFDLTAAQMITLYKETAAYTYEAEFDADGAYQPSALWNNAKSYAANKVALDKAAVVQYGVNKDALKAGIAAIATNAYSTTKKASEVGTVDATDYFTAKEYADAIVAALVETVNEAKLEATDDTLAEVAAKDSALEAAVVAAAKVNSLPNADYQKAYYDATNKVYILADQTILTVAKENANNAQLDSYKQARKADINSAISSAYASFANNYGTTEGYDVKSEQFKKLVEAYRTIETEKVDALTTPSDGTPATFPTYTFAAKTATVPYEISETGTTEYIKGEEALGKVKTLGTAVVASADYSKTKTVGGYTLEEQIALDIAAVIARAENTANDAVAYSLTMYDGYKYTETTEFAKATAVAELEAAYAAIEEAETYYAPELAEVKKIYDEAIADVNAANNQDAIAEIVSAHNITGKYATAFGKINDKTEVAKLFTTNTDQNGVKAFGTNWATVKSQLQNYMNYKNADKTVASEKYANFANVSGNKYAAMNVSGAYAVATIDTDAEKFWVNYFAETEGVRTAEALTAAYAKATAMIDAVASVSDVATAKKADKEAIEAAIKALPAASQLKVEDRAALEKIFNDAAEYSKKYGDAVSTINGYSTTFTSDVRIVEGLEAAAITKALADAKIAAKADATLENKATVVALVAQYKAYTDGFATGEMYKTLVAGGTQSVTYPILGAWTGASDATTCLGVIEDLELKAVKDAVKALPEANAATANDKTAIDAARKLYDAYVADYNYAYDATKTPTSYDAADALKAESVKLLALETIVGELTKWTDKDAKAAVYDMAKTTSYTKPTAKSVKLTAKADVTEIVENGYTVKYRFYQKGPKKTSYRLWKTTTSDTYTFTGLKKGTHYFKVKISVYDAEGNLVAYKYTNYRYLKIK